MIGLRLMQDQEKCIASFINNWNDADATKNLV